MQEPCCKHQRRFYLQILKQFHSFETLSDDDIDLQATGRIYQKFRRRECCFGSNIPPAHVRESVATYLLLSGKLLTFEQHVNIVADRVLAPDRLCNLFAFLPFFYFKLTTCPPNCQVIHFWHPTHTLLENLPQKIFCPKSKYGETS